MILTNQQKYIVEVLKQLKYLRVRQLHAMMQAHFGPLGIEIGEHRLNVMLRQLRMASNFVFLKKDLITYGQREISEHYLEAIDVMLELTENTPIFYSQDRLLEPCLLRFGGDGEMLGLLFSVTWLDIPGRIAAAPSGSPTAWIWAASTCPNTISLPTVSRTAHTAFMALRSLKEIKIRR